MKLYFATRESNGGQPRVAVICREVERFGRGYCFVNPLNSHLNVVRPSRIGVQSPFCAIAFSKEEALGLFYDGVRSFIKELENCVPAYLDEHRDISQLEDNIASERDLLTSPVEEVFEGRLVA